MSCWVWLTPLLALAALLGTFVCGLFNAWLFVPRVRDAWRTQPLYYRAIKVLMLPFWVIVPLGFWYLAIRGFFLAINHRPC